MSVYSNYLLSLGPSLYWPLDEDDGATDQSGNGNDGTAEGGVTIGGFSGSPKPFPADATSTDFDGSDDYVGSSYLPFIDGTVRTFCAWVNLTTTAGEGAAHTIVGGHSSTNGFIGWDVFRRDVRFFADSDLTLNTWAGACQQDTDTFLVLVVDQAANTVELWQDGVSQGSQANANSWASSKNCRVGLTSTANPADGQMADVAVFEKALTAPQIRTLYNIGATGRWVRPRVLRESTPDTAALYVDTGTGLERTGGDEQRLPLTDYSFGSTQEGGFATLDATVIAPQRERHPFAKLQNATLRLDTGETLWEGRVDAIAEASEAGAVELQCVGHSVRLAESELVYLGVSNDLSLWFDPPVSRIEEQADTNSASTNQDFQLQAGEDGVQITMDSDRNVDTSARGEAWWGKYGEVLVAEAQYIASQTQSTNMDPEIRTFDDPEGTNTASANVTTGLTLTTFSPSAAAPYIVIRDTPTSTVNKGARTLTFHAISVYGDHELATHSVENLPDGLLFSDVLEDLIGQFASGIATSRHGVSTIARSSDPSPDLAWLESTSIREILDEQIVHEPERTWMVWEGPTFHLTERSSGARWVVRRSEGAEFTDQGRTAEEDYNVVVVNYTDRDGRSRRAGPPGWGVDTEDASLRDDDPTNPVNAAGVGDKPLVVDAGQSGPNRAITIGALALAEATREHFAGEVSLPRYAWRDGVWSPTSLLRANDVIFDADNGQELPVLSASYSRSSERPAQATIDTPANRLDAVLAGLEARPRKVRVKRIRRRRRRQRRRRLRQRNR